jgi:hypothetical protein
MHSEGKLPGWHIYFDAFEEWRNRNEITKQMLFAYRDDDDVDLAPARDTESVKWRHAPRRSEGLMQRREALLYDCCPG